MTLDAPADMRRDLDQLKCFADAGLLTPERFASLLARLHDGVTAFEELVEGIEVGQIMRRRPSASIQGLPVCRARYVGRFTVFDGGQS